VINAVLGDAQLLAAARGGGGVIPSSTKGKGTGTKRAGGSTTVGPSAAATALVRALAEKRLSKLPSHPPPTLSWAMRGAAVPFPAAGVPGVAAFFASTTTSTTLTGCFSGIAAARRVADAFRDGLDVAAGWSATASAGGHGSKAYVVLTKTRQLHAARVAALKAGQAEVVRLRRLLASLPDPPVERGQERGAEEASTGDVAAAAGGGAAPATAVAKPGVAADAHVAADSEAAATDGAAVAPADAPAARAVADDTAPAATLGSGGKRPRSAAGVEAAGSPAGAVGAQLGAPSESHEGAAGGSGKRPRPAGSDGGSA